MKIDWTCASRSRHLLVPRPYGIACYHPAPMKDVVTAEDVRAVAPGGELRARPGAIVTPWAREIAASRGVRIVLAAAGAGAASVALGADHGGFALKEELKGHLARLGYAFRDFGTFSAEPVDYPDVAHAVAKSVRAGESRLGILVDGAGIGSAMAANKVPGIRAAACHDGAAAKNAREHNDANVLTLGARVLDGPRVRDIVETFLRCECSEERHRRRVAKIEEIEKAYSK